MTAHSLAGMFATVAGAAITLGVSEALLADLVDRGRIPVRMIKGREHVELADAARALQAAVKSVNSSPQGRKEDPRLAAEGLRSLKSATAGDSSPGRGLEKHSSA